MSVGDAEVARQITRIPAFQSAGGKFDRETYRMALRQEGFTEADFEERVRSDLTRSVVQGVITSGVQSPAPLTAAFTAFVTESRSLAWAEIAPADLPAQPAAPTEEQLKAWYDAHTQNYTSPESREISYVWLTPDMLKDEAAPDEATLRAMYEQRHDEFNQPERRMVDKLVFPTEEEALAAKARLDAGQIGFEDLARERGLDIADIDLGEVSKADLGAAGDAVFALKEPGVAGPVQTDLGPALFKMNGILNAEATGFDEAKTDLAAEATIDRARRMIADMSADLEDRLASGATLEEMAKETRMQLGHIAMTAQTTEGIAAYQGFRDAANAATQEDFPTLANLDDGSVFALRLDGTTPAAPIPFDQVRDRVAADWSAAELGRLKVARAEEIAAAVSAGAALADQGLVVSNAAAVERTGFIEGVPPSLIRTAFETAPGKPSVINEGGRVFVVVPGQPIAADPQDPEVAQLHNTLSQRLAQSIANDLLMLYATSAQSELGLTVNTAAINAVQAQMQ
ncbi:peptidyl-prolyl cis-trans isomerase [Paenirhodobacter sp.]|uniref:peptidyl-prolyl cis-trans isomerase n=1 Tax=Paenirhodobacter sp. TaxID=1965326 RepID=UPI003B407ABD